MRQNASNIILFLLVAAAFTGLFWFAQQNWFPKQDQGKKAGEEAAKAAKDGGKPTPEAVAAAAGGAAAGAAELPPPPKPKPEVKPPAPPAPPAPPPEPSTLVALGGNGHYIRALLSTRGGGVQQVILPQFHDADRLGREVKIDGKPAPLYLLPGIVRHRPEYLRDPLPIPDLAPGKALDPHHPDTPPEKRLNEPSYTIFGYEGEGKAPDPFLGEMNWRLVSEDRPDGGEHRVVFETTLGDPHFLRIRKTYTLGPKDYHIGLRIEFERLKDGPRAKVRYQLSGPRGLPIEGEWYTTTYRVALVGYNDRKGTPRRQYEDAASVTLKRGGEQLMRAENSFKYAVIQTQFFASGMCPDDTVEGSGKWWAYVRATSELLPLLPDPEDLKQAEEAVNQRPDDPVAKARLESLRARTKELLDRKLPQFDDITVRAVAEPFDLGPGDKVTHSYLLYNGPAKVRLLGLLRGEQAVDDGLVTRYHDSLGLKTVTDYRSPTALGAFADAIYWSDLVIACTNFMHHLLDWIHHVIPNWALAIVMLTVLVRLVLFVPSKKQTQMNLKMMAIQAQLKPELDKLHEKYKNDFHAYNQAKTRLMMQHGVNPFAAMGGCLLLFAQMPVMMGLYFCLQESIFFRLEPFLWVDNLSAPDMLVWWGEHIPWISTPADIGSLLYLGPYLNVLPILAVALMIYQQNKMMPPPTDEQMAQQQRMMKFMMILVAFMFYKVAAGLAVYFIVTTLWGVVERRLIPKAPDKPGDDAGAAAKLTPKGGSPNGVPALPRPKGFFGRLREAMRKRMEELQKQAEEQASRQVRNNPNRQEPIRNPDRRDGDRKKKKRRK
jgi:YidC/Oxa1 family membrane protein insertase